MAGMSKAGRPTKFKPEYVEQAEKLCRIGATDEQLAEFFGVCVATINNWKNEQPSFLESLKRGKDFVDAQVERSLFQRATGYEHDAVKIFNAQGEPLIVPYREKFPPDTTAAIFWLKNRQPEQWRDKVEHDHSGGVTVHLNGSDAEL